MAKTGSRRKVPQVRTALAEAVSAHRARRGLSQQTVAQMAGTTQGTICEIEKKKANPRLDTIERIADALGLTVVISEAA